MSNVHSLSNETLRMFCSTDVCRPALLNPFRTTLYDKPVIVATDGHRLISIPDDGRNLELPEYMQDIALPNVRGAFPGDLVKHSMDKIYVLTSDDIARMIARLPAQHEIEPCDKCFGGKKKNAECEHCRGTGNISLSCHICDDYHDIECCACNGTGMQEGCARCEGTGEIEKRTRLALFLIPWRNDRVCVNAVYLRSILCAVPTGDSLRIFIGGREEVLIFQTLSSNMMIALMPMRMDKFSTDCETIVFEESLKEVLA